MKIASLIARLLLGLMFFVFGLNGFLNFIPAPASIPGPAGAFNGAMQATHYTWFVSGVQVIAGVMLLTNQYVPLAIVTLACFSYTNTGHARSWRDRWATVLNERHGHPRRLGVLGNVLQRLEAAEIHGGLRLQGMAAQSARILALKFFNGWFHKIFFSSFL